MDTFRLKNIIILILALVNLCLLGSLGLRQVSRQNASREAARQMATLFQKDGVTLDESAIPDTTPPAGRTLTRSTDLDASLAAAILGTTPSLTNKGGGIYAWQSGSDSAQFRANGSFDISCSVPVEDPESFVSDFCRKFNCGDLVSTAEDGTGTITVAQYYGRLPVVNSSITFQFQSGVLLSVGGTHIPDSSTALNGQEPLSALSALSIFLEERRSSGAVMSAVSQVYLCYELQSTTADPMLLSPAWCIVTDTVNYYVNCLTGAVSHG